MTVIERITRSTTLKHIARLLPEIHQLSLPGVLDQLEEESIVTLDDVSYMSFDDLKGIGLATVTIRRLGKLLQDGCHTISPTYAPTTSKKVDADTSIVISLTDSSSSESDNDTDVPTRRHSTGNPASLLKFKPRNGSLLKKGRKKEILQDILGENLDCVFVHWDSLKYNVRNGCTTKVFNSLYQTGLTTRKLKLKSLDDVRNMPIEFKIGFMRFTGTRAISPKLYHLKNDYGEIAREISADFEFELSVYKPKVICFLSPTAYRVFTRTGHTIQVTNGRQKRTIRWDDGSETCLFLIGVYTLHRIPLINAQMKELKVLIDSLR